MDNKWQTNKKTQLQQIDRNQLDGTKWTDKYD